MSTDPKNHLMWAHYANGFKGICVGFDFKKYKENTTLCSMVYSQKRPELTIEKLLDNTLREEYIWELMLTKSRCWEYEKEYRMLFNIDEEERKKDFILKDISTEIITEIYFTTKADIKLLNDLENVLKKDEYSHLRLFHLKNDNTRNTYDFEVEESTIEEILEYNKHFELTWR